MALDFSVWWKLVRSYIDAVYNWFIKPDIGWWKILTSILSLIFLIGGVLVITLTFVFLILCQELAKLLLLLAKKAFEKAKDNPTFAFWLAFILFATFALGAYIHVAESNFKPKQDLLTSNEGTPPEVIVDIVPKKNTHGTGSAKPLSQVLKEWERVYEVSPEFRRISDKIYQNLGIDGRKFFAAVDFHESGGNGFRLGDRTLNKKAYGRLQIRQTALDDLQRLGYYHDLDDLVGNNNQELINSAKAFDLYVSLYLESSEESNLNAYLNTWNGGPNGTAKDTPYTVSVSLILKRIK